ncbi:MAG: hypothetical protein IKP40_14225 [Clostridia bacterium]|nr:hypothetical protein [Clostridia bacterium]
MSADKTNQTQPVPRRAWLLPVLIALPPLLLLCAAAMLIAPAVTDLLSAAVKVAVMP